MVPDLTLYADTTWMSPWIFHAFVALEEKGLPFKLEALSRPIPPESKHLLLDKALLGTIPALRHGDAWISESLAISEYLAETFPSPTHPRLFPANLVQRAHARQVMSWIRTSMRALRDDRPTSCVFGRPTIKPFSEQGKVDADTLVRVASRLVAPGKLQMFDEWSIADCDLSLMLMRMIACEDAMPEHLIRYALAQWDRKSVRRYIAHLPTSP